MQRRVIDSFEYLVDMDIIFEKNLGYEPGNQVGLLDIKKE